MDPQQQQQQQQQQGEDDGHVDLDAFLSVLERDQLERLVVRMILKDESNFEELQRAARQLSDEAILEAVENAQIALEDAGLEAFLTTIAPFVDKAVSYAKLGYAPQALTVLVNISHPTVSALAEQEDLPETGSEERAVLDAFLRRLEAAWQAAAAKFTPVASTGVKPAKEMKTEVFEGGLLQPPETYDGLFALLAEWRTELTPKLGPLFSDPLRVLKKAIVNQGKDATAAAAAAAAAATKGPQGQSPAAAAAASKDDDTEVVPKNKKSRK